MIDANAVTAVVVTYNRLALLQQCLAALCAQTVRSFTVLVVDNASTDGTADYLKTLDMPGLVCRNPGKNLGGAGGFAYGIRAAAEGYFGKAPIDMTDYECTLLAGIPNAPSVYSLTANPELAEQRQEYVVQRMVQYGYISEDEAQSILQDQS